MKKIAFTLLALTLLLMLAFPTAVMAKTNWDLEGWRIDASKWMDGLLFTYYEGDWVPYRLEANRYDGVDTVISIQHDYMDSSGHIGIDAIQDVYIGPTTPRGTDPGTIIPYTVAGGGYFDVSGPVEIDVPNGKVIEYTFTIPDPDALVAEIGTNDFAIYWDAHCSLTGSPGVTWGSSYWNGASLHAHTSVTGNQDVPIKTPPVAGPSPDPSIDIIKYLSTDGINWLDANNYVNVKEYDDMYFKIVVTNTGNVELTGIQIEDIFANQDGPDDPTPIWEIVLDLGTYPSSLAPGASFEIVYGPFEAGYCFHSNIASVSAVYDDVTYGDEDFAKYKGYY